MTWLALLKVGLQLVAWIARQAERTQIETAVLSELENLNNDRVKDAAAARDDVQSGRVPVDPNDPNLRD